MALVRRTRRMPVLIVTVGCLRLDWGGLVTIWLPDWSCMTVGLGSLGSDIGGHCDWLCLSMLWRMVAMVALGMESCSSWLFRIMWPRVWLVVRRRNTSSEGLRLIGVGGRKFGFSLNAFSLLVFKELSSFCFICVLL